MAPTTDSAPPKKESSSSAVSFWRLTLVFLHHFSLHFSLKTTFAWLTVEPSFICGAPHVAEGNANLKRCSFPGLIF